MYIYDSVMGLSFNIDLVGKKASLFYGQYFPKSATFRIELCITEYVHKLAAIAATFPFTVVVSYTYVLCICVAMSHQTKKRLE